MDLTRVEVAEHLADALVILPIGAVEQHGPHLPTGTDSVIVETVAHRAADLAAAAASRTLIIAPSVMVGASDHHLWCAGTLSLSVSTTQAVLTDLLRSIAETGGRRVAIINGHGGNRGPVTAAAADASTTFPLTVATANYWQLAHPDMLDPQVVPGHAGRFETTMMMAVAGERIGDTPVRDAEPLYPSLPGTDFHGMEFWKRIDGYTDHPQTSDIRQAPALLKAFVTATADWFTTVAKEL
jgi:creatinine amidohydrolase